MKPSSRVALATANFDAVVAFYAGVGFAVVDAWDRPCARGRLFDLHGLTLEVLDAAREKAPLELPPVGDRVHLVVEVPDVDAVARALPPPAPVPADTSWGARLLSLRDPDGVNVTFLERLARSPG